MQLQGFSLPQIRMVTANVTLFVDLTHPLAGADDTDAPKTDDDTQVTKCIYQHQLSLGTT